MRPLTAISLPVHSERSRPVGRQSLADSRMAAWECRPTFFPLPLEEVRGNGECFTRLRRNPKKFNAGFRARPIGDFCFGKTPEPPPYGAQAAETASALRASLAAESRRRAFLPHHPTSQENPVRNFLCRALETMLLAPGLRAEHGLPVHILPRRGPPPQAVGHHCTDPNNRRGFPTCTTAKHGQRESATIERAGQSETEFNNSIRSSILGSVNEIVCYLRMPNISAIR